ncbi:MAG: HNH endonuclease [Nocardioides sp.]|nr:HNH endonuclease [Nocardioides sp.]
MGARASSTGSSTGSPSEAATRSADPTSSTPTTEPTTDPASAPSPAPTAPTTPTAAPDPTPDQTEPTSVDAPLRRAVRLLVVAAEQRDGYDRDLFRHWSDLDDDGCDTRDEVLVEEDLSGSAVDDCRPVAGRWRSTYDGVVTTDAGSFDVDHVVPLAEAWDSGAAAWSAERREAFANDLGDPRRLVAVSASSNRSKSDADPPEWMPDLARCAYARDWVAVKLRWSLSVDRVERRVLLRLARRCDGRVRVERVP